MPKDQESSQCRQDQPIETQSETQGLENAQGSQAVEETSPSSPNLLMSGNLMEAPAAKMLSTPDGPLGFCSLASAVAATSSSIPDESSSSEEEEKSPSTSQATAAPENMPTDALNEKVALLVNFMLLKYQMKEPITKAEILKTIIKDDEDQYPEIFLRASDRMEIIFGLDVKEVDPTSHCYGLFIKLGLTYDGMLSVEEGVPKTGLLILILGAIFMKGNRATEEEVWEMLNVMGVYRGRKHFIFGEPREFFTKELVKENYLEYRQVPNSDPAQYEFLWGPRAHAETRKMKVLEFVAKVHGTDPSSFPSQYEEALQDEEERAQARISVRAGSTSTATESSSAMSGSSSHT
ncbi:melanoma-associated antigen B16-like [Microcebus murinus]|uniref:melanoma-associated antigen B16-like n=1 Tax=Microcebus murinus TaxID=30608 RepID=UPI00098B5566|nr:melanoma-associated antigen B16-like [Microcebus murinus]XP_020140558.1 melanoma-associated antigen B16-like [Microcebus murinus]